MQRWSAEKEILEVVENVLQKRVSERTQIVDVPQIVKETPGVVRLAPRERVQRWTVDALTPWVLEETVEVGRVVLHEREPQRAATLVGEARCVLQEVDVDQQDHRDGTYKKEALVTVAFWDEGLSLIGFVTVFVRTVRVIFQATDSLALVVM